MPGDYPSISMAMVFAHPGDTVLVAPGTYHDLCRETEFGPAKVKMTSRVTLLSEGGSEVTIIDAERECRVIFCEGTDEGTIIEGFTIARGEASGAYPDGYGGGVFCKSSVLLMRDCIVTGNVAATGGGFLCIDGSSPIVEGCRITNNEAVSRGGGIYSASSTPSFTDCVIAGNRAGRGGAASFAYDHGARLVACTISANAATDRGGGLYVLDTGERLELLRTILRGNCAPAGEEGYLEAGVLSLECCAIDPEGLDPGSGEILEWGEQVTEDPLFCDPRPCHEAPTPLGTYTLAENSPCLPHVSPCGELIGALPLGCEPSTPAVSVTWGRLKSFFSPRH